MGVDSTFPVPLITMEKKIYPTEQDERNVNQILDYMETYPNAVVGFNASDMVLRADINVSYMNKTKAHICTAWYFLKEYTFKMCAGAPKWPNTCTLQNNECFAAFAAEVVLRI